MRGSRILLTLCTISSCAFAAPAASDCTGTISSISDVAAAVACTTIVINAFTVPAGETFNLDLLDSTTVTMKGDVTFGTSNWAGPLFQVSGTNINFDGAGFQFNGNGAFYWDGQGINGGVTKPDPMMKIKMSGTFTNVGVLNSPARVYSVSNPAPLTMSHLVIDNSAGDAPNSKSGTASAGHNTDGFDVSSEHLTIRDSTIHNQDDCLAINNGDNIAFTGNSCTGGHGISIGSISSGAAVSKITISDNTITDNDQALRIKTRSDATDASVTTVTYSGNTATGMRRFGIIIDQSYPDTLGTPGNGVVLSGISFIGTENNIAVASGAERVAVNCGSGSCTGAWDWSALTVTGGTAGTINYSGITGFSN